jgi:hypothetical protein
MGLFWRKMGLFWRIVGSIRRWKWVRFGPTAPGSTTLPIASDPTQSIRSVDIL